MPAHDLATISKTETDATAMRKRIEMRINRYNNKQGTATNK